MRTTRMECGSARTGPLATGCEHCLNGSKMVLFVTGLCDSGCFYCPVSFERKDKDAVYADEMLVSEEDDIIEEAVSIGATGTGITGGDPLLNIDRTVSFIRMLKARFGPDHHIHLYTATMDADKAGTLRDAGLDEIRFHPPEHMWDRLEETPLREIAEMGGMDVGIEVPALPGHEDGLRSLLDFCDSAAIKFVNLNELEFSESNWHMMEDMKYGLLDEISSAVGGSAVTAAAVMRGRRKTPVHFCSSAFKDGVQLRRRLIRRAERVAEDYDLVTDDGTILRGLLYADDPGAAVELMADRYDVPKELMRISDFGLEIASWIIEELASELPYKCYISERYPTADGLEVERVPLN
ncbi:MAG: radical SAM protein [Candidatus Methanomethylophilaceae archaeon]|jgi:pyruvate formate-lyase activating enzyme-like uncharacterized protein